MGAWAARLYASFAIRHDAERNAGGPAAPAQQARAASRGASLACAVETRESSTAPRDAHAPRARILIPIDATERSRWAVRYATGQHRGEVPLEAHLLYVAEPITRWEVLRFRTQAEIARFQTERAHWLLEDAAVPLRQAGIATVTHLREGDAAFEILDAAEQLGCDRIVLPRPLPRWRTLLGRDLARDVSGRARNVRVVTIGPNGDPAP